LLLYYKKRNFRDGNQTATVLVPDVPRCTVAYAMSFDETLRQHQAYIGVLFVVEHGVIVMEEHITTENNVNYTWKIVQIVGMTLFGAFILVMRYVASG